MATLAIYTTVGNGVEQRATKAGVSEGSQKSKIWEGARSSLF